MGDMFNAFVNSLISLLFCMLVGFICRKIKLLDDTLIAGLTKLLVKVTLPCTVFISLMRPFSRTLLLESVATFFLSGLIYLGGGLLGVLLARLMKANPTEKRVWIFALIFANVGYMGFPVSQAVFGDTGLIYTSMANASFNFLAFTIGVRLFNPKEPGQTDALPGGLSGWRMIAFNPALIATLAGFICFVTGFRFPTPILNGASMIGGMTTPVSMLLVGAILAKNKLRSLFADFKILPVIAVRLAVVPLVAFAVLRPWVANPMMLGVIVMLSAMPVASLTAIFAEQYRGDTALASKLVALSTLLCVVTVPFISLLFTGA